MARSYGRTSPLHWKLETVDYGTAATGNFAKIPYFTCDLDKQQDVEAVPLAGAGLGQEEIFKGLPDVSGNLEMPLCMRNIGYLLTGLMGAPSSSEDDGTYTHTFSSQTATLPSASV